MIFGLDANTYKEGDAKWQDVTEFANDYVAKGMTSCWGDAPNPKNFTVFNARTYMQPQLNKAVKKEEKDIKGDKNPKDFILFYNKEIRCETVTKDNTGKQSYIEDMVFPTLEFPSDHAVVSSKLTLL